MQIHAGRPSSLIHLRKNFNDILYYASQKEFLLSRFALFNSSNQKEKEKKINYFFFFFFPRLTELQRMSGLVSLAFLRIAQMAPLKWMCLISEQEKEKNPKNV